GVGHHGAGQDDRLAREPGGGQRPRGLDHRVGAVRDDEAGFRRIAAATDDVGAAALVEVEAVDHHYGLDRHVDPAPAAIQHLLDVRVLEKETAGELVVLLVERAAGHQYPDRHTVSVLSSDGGGLPKATGVGEKGRIRDLRRTYALAGRRPAAADCRDER